MSYGPRPKDGNYSVRQLVSFHGVSKAAAAEAIAKRPGQPQRQISYAYRKSQETDSRNRVTSKIEVTSTSNLIIDGEDSGQKSMIFYDILEAFDALDFEKQNDWTRVADGYIKAAKAGNSNPQIKYVDRGVTYIFSY